MTKLAGRGCDVYGWGEQLNCLKLKLFTLARRRLFSVAVMSNLLLYPLSVSYRRVQLLLLWKHCLVCGSGYQSLSYAHCSVILQPFDTFEHINLPHFGLLWTPFEKCNHTHWLSSFKTGPEHFQIRFDRNGSGEQHGRLKKIAYEMKAECTVHEGVSNWSEF